MPTENEKFQLDPVTYAKSVCINLQTAGGMASQAGFNSNLAYSPAYFNLAPWSSSVFSSTKQVVLQPQATYKAGLIQAYYVPYIAYGTITSNNTDMVPLWDVPVVDPPFRYIFTGGQNGCSLLLLKGDVTGSTVAALHYPNSDGKAKGYPLLERIGKTAADVILAIDFDLYGEDAHPNACSFFYYTKGQWIGVTQPQIQGGPDMKWRRCSMLINQSRGVRTVSETGIGTA